MKVLNSKSLKFLEEYLNNAAPTGYESNGQKIWMKYLRPYVDDFITDNYGTAVGVINPDKKYKVVITKSTVPVTTGDKIEKILIKQKRKKLVDVVSNPEFLREGEAIRDFLSPDRVVVGTDSNKANKYLKNLYLPIVKKTSRYFRTSRRGAELIKYASNAFLATKISYINELANLFWCSSSLKNLPLDTVTTS